MTSARTMWTRHNRERQNAAWRKWYRTNAKRKRAWEKRRREEIREWFDALRATKVCERCGESTPECLQFHHTDPATKKFEVSLAVCCGFAKTRIIDEIAKCIVLCANCHLKLHWERRHEEK